MATFHRMPRPADFPIGINRRLFNLGLSAEELGVACYLIAENSPHCPSKFLSESECLFVDIKRKELARIFKKLEKFGILEETNGNYYVSAKYDVDR